MAEFHQRIRMWTLIGMLLIASLLTYCSPANAGAHYYDAPAAESYTYPRDYDLVTEEQEWQAQTGHGRTPLSLRIDYPLETHYADVTFHNELVHHYFLHNTVTFILRDGNSVMVYFTYGNGDLPDVFTVIPPPGYIAIPMEMSVDEGWTGTIEIHEYTGG